MKESATATEAGDIRVENQHRCTLSRYRKLVAAAASLAFALAIVAAVVIILSPRSTTRPTNAKSFDANIISNSIDGNAAGAQLDMIESNVSNNSVDHGTAAKIKIDAVERNTSNPNDDGSSAVKTKIESTESLESNADIVTFSGNISDFFVANQDIIRQSSSSSSSSSSSFSATNCPIDEGLWNLQILTDNYPWETKWELHDNSTHVVGGNTSVIVASGPPDGLNYERRTRYTGNLCLPIGQYYFMRWFDAMGDGLCCKYGQGEWTVRVDGEVVLESINDPNNNSNNVKQKDFPFQVTTTNSDADELKGTFLMPRANVELADGTIFELINLPPDFDRADGGLVSGITSIALPVGTKLFSNATADMKGSAPRALGSRFLADHQEGEIETLSSSSMRRNQKQVTSKNLRASNGHRQLGNDFIGDQSVLVVRVIAADRTTTADETALSNGIFGNGVDLHNLVSQFKACSYGKLNLMKADVPNGVVTVRLPSIRTTQGDGTMRNAITNELNEMFNVDSPSQLADYVIYCLPAGAFTNGTGFSTIAYAFYNSWLSVFNDDWCMSLSLQMHEIGHSMNFGHSNEGGETYEDESGFMGYSYPNIDGPRKCFNAAKSWQSGW